jgi:secondary thiamine-phosphate synthase enzyme
MLRTAPVRTGARVELVDITSLVKQIVSTSGVVSGLCSVYVPHTTAGVTINENADPTVKDDILMELNKIVPFNDNYRHSEGNSAAHIKASMVGTNINIIIDNSNLVLGTWQGIYFCEFDGPRNRKVYIKIIKD